MEASQEKQPAAPKKTLLSQLFGPRLRSSKRFWATMFVAFYTLFGFFALPYIIKSQLSSLVPDLTARDFSIAKVRFNPYALSLSLSGVSLADKDGVELAGFDEFYVNFQTSSLINWAWTFGDISIDGPRGNIRIDEDGNPSFQDLLATAEPVATEPPPSVEEEAALPRLVIHRLAVNNGHFLFSDHSIPTPYKQELHPVAFELTAFSTLPERDGPYQVKLVFPYGGQLAWQGDISVNPLRATGRVEVSAVQVREMWRYVQDQLRFSVGSGQLAISANYEFSMADQGPELTVDQIAVNLTELAISDKARLEPDLRIADISLLNGQLSLHEQRVQLDEISITSIDLKTFMTKDAELDLARLFSPVDADADTVQKSIEAQPEELDDAKPWQISLNRFAINKSQVAFADQSTEPTAEIMVDEFEFVLSNINNQNDALFGLQAGMRINQQGRLKINGEVGALPVVADLTLVLDSLVLKEFQPYLNATTFIGIEDGALKFDGKLQYFEAATPQLFRLSGSSGVQKLATVNSQSGDKVVAWNELQIKDFDLKLQPDSVSISDIKFDQLNSHVVIAADGVMNVASLVKPSEAEAAEPEVKESQESKTEPFPISIDTVSFNDGAVTFIDNTMSPRFTTKLSRFKGAIKGLSSAELARADVVLDGRVDDVAQLSVTGKINPLKGDLYSDIKIRFDDFDMTAVTPYTGHFIGKAVDKGQLELDLGYRVSERELVGENEISLDQFTLGRDIKSEEAVDLPVGLAIALLKDANGRIDLSLPVRGNLDEPEFKISKIVFKALFNTITGIVTSPFKLLSKLAGGDQELDKVAFVPGELNMVNGHQSRLESLAKALTQRPQLRIEVRGLFDPNRDVKAIQEQKLAAFFELSEDVTFADLKLSIIEAKLNKQLGKETLTTIKAANMVLPEGTKEKAKPELDVESYRFALYDSSLKAQAVTDDELRDLARSRASQIRNFLVENAELSPERVFIMEAEADDSANEAGVLTLFQLSVD